MAREFAKALYHSPAWLRNRKLYMDMPVDTSGHRLFSRYRENSSEQEYYWVEDGGYDVVVSPDRIVPPGMCERCFARGEYVSAKVVHHIVHVSPENVDDPHVTLSFDNFMRLCQDCHAAVHSSVPESRVTFDEFGNVVWKETDGTHV